MDKKFVYQIYVSTFNDSNNDGIGDLKGIKERLPYLSQLGVDYLWLTPFYASSFYDNGYDIKDYYQVDKRFGTRQDLINLIDEAKKYQIKIMIDLVFNHTSVEHQWFKKWQAGDQQYQDFYFKKFSTQGEPNNWKSKFGGPAWKEYRKNWWYLHLFDEHQADLNWESLKVRQELKKIVEFYLKLGVKGFRFDVINLISKNNFKNSYTDDGRKYYTDGKKVLAFLQELNQTFPKNDRDFLTVGELSSTSINQAWKYANQKNHALDSVFTFHHLKIDYHGSQKFVDCQPDIEKFNNILAKWAVKMQKKDARMANFLNNHDQPRALSRFINDNFQNAGAKMLFALTSSLPGIPFIYQGEEIGMTNYDFKKISDFHDVESLNFLKVNNQFISQGLKQKSRDNARTVMQWNNQKYAGFSQVKPSSLVNDNYKQINVAKNLKTNNSIFHFYQSFIKFLKGDQMFIYGKISFNEFKNNLISYNLKMKKIVYLLVFSFNDQEVDYLFEPKSVIQSNYPEFLKNKLKPYQFLIIKKGDE